MTGASKWGLIEVPLTARGSRRLGDAWHGYIYKKNHTRFEQPKLLVPAIATGSCFTLDREGHFYFVGSGGGGGGYGITPRSDSRVSELYLLALLNSRLLDYMLHQVSTPFRGGYLALNRQYIEVLPIRPINFADPAERAEHDALVALAERILAAKRTDSAADTSALEREIDDRVFHLYALTPEEIGLVQGGTP